MFILLLINFLFSEMSNNFGAHYYALNRGGRSFLQGSEAVILNPSNLVTENSSLSINGFCYDAYCSFGTSYADNSGLGLFISIDELDKNISYDSFSVFGSLALQLSERFSIGGSFGYFHSNLFTSEIKFTSSMSFSPYSLEKQFDKWLISAGYLSNFLNNNIDEYFFSYTYIDKLYAISLDFLISEDNNYEVLAGAFTLTDSLKLVSSIKFIEISTDDLSYAFGLKYFSDYVSLMFSILIENDNTFYALSLNFYGE